MKRLWLVTSICVGLIIVARLHFAQCDNFHYIEDITCTQQLQTLDIPHDKIDLIAECPQFCLKGHCRVRGSSPYTATSSCCCAAIHHGSINNDEGGRIHIRINHGSASPSYGSTRNGVTSRSYSSSTYGTFTFVGVIQSELERNNQTDDELFTTKAAIVTSQPSSSSSIMTSPVEVLRTEVQQHDTQATSQLTTTLAPQTNSTKTTQAEATSRSFTSASRSFTNHHNYIAATTQTTSLNVTVSVVLSIRHSHFILYLVAVFVTGIILTVIALFLGKKLRHKQGKNTNRGWRSRGKSTSRTEENEVCVCYTSVSNSHQGLLTDPETCIRPCPNRHLEDSEPDSVTVEQESLLLENCTFGCSEKCCPEQFNF